MNHSAVQIRPFAKSDLPACAAVFIHSYNAPPHEEGWTAEAAARRLAELAGAPHFLCFVAEEGDVLRGFAAGCFETWPAGRQFRLLELCVLPDCRRQGIGVALMEALLEQLVRSNVGALHVLAGRGTPAEAFFRSCGLFENPRAVQFVQRFQD